MNPAELYARISRSIDADTAWVEDWSPEDRWRGQCGTVALVVRRFLGGGVVEGDVLSQGVRVRHYWNVTRAGWQLDFAWQQFDAAAAVLWSRPTDPDDLLPNPWFEARYRTLLGRVETDAARGGMELLVESATTAGG